MTSSTVILIIDDDAVGRETLEALLQPLGYQLAFAERGAVGLVLAAKLRPDIILLDVMMPEMDGFEVCRRIRADPALAEVPVLLLTALDDRASRLQGIDAGADDFIVKPFDRAELRARIRTIARLNRYRHLVAGRARFERVIERSPIGFVLLAPDGAILLDNPAARDVFRSGDEPLIGERAQPFIAPEQSDLFEAELRRVTSEPGYAAQFESLLVSRRGDLIPVEIDLAYLEWDDGPAAQMRLQDISARKLADERQRRQIAQLTALHAIDNAIVASFDLSLTLEIVLDQVIDELHVDAAAILLRRTLSQSFEYTLVRGYARESLSHSVLNLGEGAAGWVALERRMLTMPELTALEIDLPLTDPMADYYGVPLVVKGQVEGVLELFHRTQLGGDIEWHAFLQTVAGQAALAIDHAAMVESMQRANAELTSAYTSTLEGWARALELRDKETEGHAQRVTSMTMTLGRAWGLSEAELIHVQRGALLHDIGKMGIPDSILLKPGPLSEEEWGVMRQHPVLAYELLARIPFLKPALEIPYCHHEKWDGSGYPRGLVGEAIPLSARLFAVVDVWDALRFDRPYRKGWPDDAVREHIRQLTGTHFDAAVVEVFLRLSPSDVADQRLRLLVVDDDATIPQLVRRLLADSFVVFTSTSVSEALEILAREQIAVIITDQRMHPLTGIQLLERAKYISPATLGVLSSAFFDHAVLSEALNLGNVRGYLHKPWTAAELRSRVNDVARQYVATSHSSIFRND